MATLARRLFPLLGLALALVASLVAARSWSAERALLSARSARASGNLDAAEGGYRRAAARGSAEAAAELAWLLLLRRRWDAALESARDAARLQPANGYHYLLVAEAEAARGGASQAERAELVARLCARATGLAPTTPGIWSRCGSLLARAGVPAGSPSGSPGPRAATADLAAFFARALDLDPRGARGYLGEALAAAPDGELALEAAAGSPGVEALQALVALLIASERWEALRPSYLERGGREGRPGEFARAAAGALARAGKRHEAYRELADGSAAAPRDAELAFLAGEAASGLGAEAAGAGLAHLREAAALDPGNLRYRLVLARRLLAAGRHAEAAAEAGAALAIDARAAEGWFTLGQSQARMGSEAATDSYRRAAELDPRNVAYRRAAGLAAD